MEQSRGSDKEIDLETHAETLQQLALAYQARQLYNGCI